MYKIYYVKALDTRSSCCSATKKKTRIFKLPSNDSIINFCVTVYLAVIAPSGK